MTLLDRAAAEPLWHQLMQSLAKRVEDGLAAGTLQPGGPFPTERAICDEYEVSTITAKRALHELVQEGVLDRRQGIGTFLARPRIEQGLGHLYSFTTQWRGRGGNPVSHTLGLTREAAPPYAARRLDLPPGADVVRLDRLRILDDEPYALEISHLPAALFPGLELADLEDVSLYELLEARYGVRPYRAREFLEATLVDEYAAELLSVPADSAALLIERVSFTTSGQPMEVCRGIVRGDRCRFAVDLIRDGQ